MYRFKRSGVEKTFVFVLAAYGILGIVSIHIPGMEYFLKVFALGYLIIIGIYNISCYAYAVYRKKEYAKMFAFFGTVGTLLGFHDIAVKALKASGINISILGYHFFYMKTAFTGMFIFLGTALVMVYRWINLTREVVDLNANLEKYIIENSLLQNKNALNKKGITFSKQFEEKIQKITDYISENYVNNLSREGLAAYVDMHPDNLSRLFNQYASMKLIDYIYHLRIKDAAERLINTDKGICEIAFEVGFESLRTFNRVFKKFLKTTPKKYRILHALTHPPDLDNS
jgi:AraC-like DNA-binding protein